MLPFNLLHVLFEINKKFLVLSDLLTGETQLRAKRTRIKILRAIAEKNGSAGFSDIKLGTGLSTGSIYYHLERMGSYVTKDAKHYVITEEGIKLLRESDSKYTKSVQSQDVEEKVRGERTEDTMRKADEQEESVGRDHFSKMHRVAFIGGLLLVGTIGIVYFAGLADVMPLTLGTNANLFLLPVLASAVALFFAYKGNRIFPQTLGIRGVALSVLSAGAIVSAILFLSDASFSGASIQNYDNSMDALLSSYSLHWQVR
jgi:hypothetical protein